MPHQDPVAGDQLAELTPVFAAAEAAMGFVPNSMLTMAHMPQLPIALMLLANTSMGGDLKGLIEQLGPQTPAASEPAQNLSRATVQLIAFACSVRAGCRYCQAHTSHSGVSSGARAAQFEHILSYESSPHFNAAERAAIAIAFAAAAVPNEVTARHFADLREHYNEAQITQIVAVISTFGFLNRWNDTMATQLESEPTEFASKHLAPLDWQLGKHA